MNVKVFFADIGLVAPFQFAFLGATVIGVTFLNFTGDAHTTATTAKKSEKCLRFILILPRRIAPTAIKNRLNGVERLLGNDWLMVTLMHLASITEMTVINRIGQHLGYEDWTDQFSCRRAHAAFCQKMAQTFHCLCAGRIPLENFFDNRCAFSIHTDAFDAGVVQISKGRTSRVITSADFFAQPALGVFGKRVHKVFAEPKIIMKHELALWRVFKPRTGEFEPFKFSGIKKVNNTTAVHTVAC